MATISNFLQFSELADASYVNFTGSMPSDDRAKLLRENRYFTYTQADNFVERYRVLATSQEYNIGTESGFSATLFEDAENPGKKILAIRGTDELPGEDWDDDIGFGGLSGGSTPLQFEDMVAFFEELQLQGIVSSGDLLNVTGHSLGGALAQAFTAAYSDFVDQTYTYNSPGAKDLDSPETLINDGKYYKMAFSGYDEFGDPLYVPVEISKELYDAYASFEANKTEVDGHVTNIKAIETWADIPQNFVSDLGTDIGSADINISISDSIVNPVHYHSIGPLVESLYIYNLFSTISGSNNTDDFTPFLEKISDERALAAINKIFQAGIDTNQQPVDLSMQLSNYAKNQGLTNLTVISLRDWSLAEIKAAAENEISVLFSLKELSSFAISGNQPGYEGLHIDDYTDQYIEDRALFLNSMTHENTTDILFKDLELDVYVQQPLGTEFISEYSFGKSVADGLTGSEYVDHLYGMGGTDILRGLGGDDYLEGGDDNDELYGGEDQDILVGGAGQDELYGESGNDTFYIQGTDTDYDIYNGGDDNDTILGSSGNDTIRVTSLSLDDNSIEVIDGGDGEDSISGTGGTDTIDLTGIEVKHIERIEGGGGQDTITGSAGDDTIYGGSQNIVEDNERDRLEGGAGHDIYHIGNGDIINDSDQQGTVRLNEQQLSNLTLTQAAANSDIYKNDGYLAQLDRNTGSLIVHDRTGNLSFTIENFTSGSFGITLQDYTAPQDNFDGTLTGTSEHDEMSILNLGSDQTNWALAYTSFPDGVTYNSPFFTAPLPATAPSLSVTGGDSGDFLFGFQSHDHIDGGRNNRFFGKAHNDTLQGAAA